MVNIQAQFDPYLRKLIKNKKQVVIIPIGSIEQHGLHLPISTDSDIVTEDFTLEFVHDMTLAIGTYFERGSVLIGFDGRESSPVISKVVSSALNSIGIDCNVAGIIPTPCLEFAVKTLGYSGGIMITASHNPPQYNGIKPVANDGVEVSREDELVIEDIYLQKSWIKNTENWGTTKKEERAIEIYLKGIVSQVDSKLIESKNFKVVLDLGNGAQAISSPVFAVLTVFLSS